MIEVFVEFRIFDGLFLRGFRFLTLGLGLFNAAHGEVMVHGFVA